MLPVKRDVCIYNKQQIIISIISRRKHVVREMYFTSIFQTSSRRLSSLHNIHTDMQPVILVHGGATQNKDNDLATKRVEAAKAAARKGYEVLTADNCTVVEAVEAAVRLMESDELFNAGRGSLLNLEGEVEMDASIMVGSNLAAGAVAAVKDVAHPISLARLVMEKTSHIILAGDGAKKFAKEQGVQILPPGSLVTSRRQADFKRMQQKYAQPQSGCTVGAVAINSHGHLAAATSTGGTEGKMVGRCSAISALGTYADDDVGAVSTTGHGESITKFCLAHAIIKAMEDGKSAQDATHDCIMAMTKKLNNTAGVITLSKGGDVGISFSSYRMPWAYIVGNEIHSGIDQNEHDVNVFRIRD